MLPSYPSLKNPVTLDIMHLVGDKNIDILGRTKNSVFHFWIVSLLDQTPMVDRMMHGRVISKTDDYVKKKTALA